MPDSVKPIEVFCPACQSKAGDKCTNATDTGRRDVNWFHLARVEAARYPLTQEGPDGSIYPNDEGLRRTFTDILLREEYQIEALEAIRTQLVLMKGRFADAGKSDDFLDGLQEAIYKVTHVKGELEAIHRMHQRQNGVKF